MRRRWTTPSFSVGRSSQVPGRFSCAVWIASAAVRSTLCAPSRRSVKDARGWAGWLAASVMPGRSSSGADASRGRRGAGDAQAMPPRRASGGAHARRRNGPVAAVVERRQHPAFELLRTRHADGHRRHAMIAEGVGNLEQMARVFTGLRARRDHAVVARELPFDPQPPRDPPHGRMEPVPGQATNASVWVRQSRRAMCASSCRMTARRRSPVHVSAIAGIRIDGRRMPNVIGIDCSRLRSKRTSLRTPMARAHSASSGSTPGP